MDRITNIGFQNKGLAIVSIRNKIIKKLVSFQISGWSKGTIEEQRTRQEKTSKYAKLPADIQCQPINVDGIYAEWINAPDADLGVILYLHGGAYALGSINVHRELIARLALATQMRCLAINYRLAPEHPFPAAPEDATAAYRWLLTQGVDPSQIIIAGDSSGGGLVLVTIGDPPRCRRAAPYRGGVHFSLDGPIPHRRIHSSEIQTRPHFESR